MDNNVGMAPRYEHEIPEGYEARIKGNKVILEPKESEDEKIRKQLISEVKEQINDMPALDCCSSDDLKRLTILESWIAYLERQKEQKSAEWSEEDENRLNNLFWIIDDSKWNEASKQGFKNFLKSLRPRPHWKPSEEDFAELTRIKDSMPNNEWGNQAEGVLDELIDNLKKL